jgi:hypothetical protein
MTTHKIVSREEWTEARRQHLAREKEFTRLRDQLSQERRELPLVLSPLVIALRLKDAPSAASRVDRRDPMLKHLYSVAGLSIPDFPYANSPDMEFARALANIRTDFALNVRDRHILNLAAYVLVHGTLRPRLREWEQGASTTLATYHSSPSQRR